MHFIDGLAIGSAVGLFAGGFLAYKYADAVVRKTIAEYTKVKTAAENVIGAVKREL